MFRVDTRGVPADGVWHRNAPYTSHRQYRSVAAFVYIYTDLCLYYSLYYWVYVYYELSSFLSLYIRMTFTKAEIDYANKIYKLFRKQNKKQRKQTRKQTRKQIRKQKKIQTRKH